MKLADLFEGNKVKSQSEMIADFAEQDTILYKKFGTFKARNGKEGEKITTVIDGEEETNKTVKDGEVVIEGPKGEHYVVSLKKFKERYEVDKDLTDDFQSFKTKGMIRGFEWTGESFKFMASWDEEMLCKKTDILATPVKDKDDESITEVYRIERSVFDETYKEVK